MYFLSATSCVDTSSTGCRTARTWRELSSHLTSSTFLEANKSASKFGSMMLILSLYLYFTSLKGVRTAMSRSTSMDRRRSTNTTSTTTCSVVSESRHGANKRICQLQCIIDPRPEPAAATDDLQPGPQTRVTFQSWQQTRIRIQSPI